MHLHLERYILGAGHKDLTDEGQVAGDMAQTIIDKVYAMFLKYGAVRLSILPRVVCRSNRFSWCIRL